MRLRQGRGTESVSRASSGLDWLFRSAGWPRVLQHLTMEAQWLDAIASRQPDITPGPMSYGNCGVTRV
ncbi:hypothetical protein VFPPC_15356 [Pochonia chlamydosporia 170]|uniref:Uncharacterized protein n=1 Tax=Pochonia chlamydosporia 170 TaxID=1380566 RepID=A0A179G9C2_METCM|nr:hypothetical protein VFPPC_15356 [Pochonia chlamydosporia 170]OAQ73759.1 hypothetical protein VFPPC_15356 [Pochonia chlamydosporia 170]